MEVKSSLPLDSVGNFGDLFVPDSLALDRANDDLTVVDDDAEVVACVGPSDVADEALLALVDHFFHPLASLVHPYDHQTAQVDRRELLVAFVPVQDVDRRTVRRGDLVVRDDNAGLMATTSFSLVLARLGHGCR